MNNRHRVMTEKLADINKRIAECDASEFETIQREMTEMLDAMVDSEIASDTEEYYRFEEEKQWGIFTESDELLLCKPREGDAENYIKLQRETTLMPSVFKMPGYEDFLREDFYDEKVFLVIIRQKSDDEFVGYCSIKNIKRERWELAIELLKKYQHKGYGRQALAMFMDKIRECTGVCDFIARVDPENIASQTMCEALAGVPDGIAEHLLHDQNYMEQYEKENAHEVTDLMRQIAVKFNVPPEKLLTHVLQYRFDMKPGVSELASLLWKIKDAYWDYVVGVIVYAKKKPERMKIVTEYVKAHMDATTSDIVWFISNQPDFYDDAAYCDRDENNIEGLQDEEDIRIINGTKFRCVGLDRKNRDDDYCQCGSNEFCAVYMHNKKMTYACVKCKKGILYEL